MTIEAIGPRITVYINGKRAAHLRNDTRGRPHGKLALQLHGGQEVDVWFKDLEIAEK
jgi:3-keto-disaccharide hydrolase